MCQLRADLMMSAGSQMNPKNGAPVFLLQNLVGKLRPLCSRCTAFHNRRRIGSAVTQKIICKLPLSGFRHSVCHGVVKLVRLARRNLPAKCGRRLLRLCEHHHAAYRLIQPVHHSDVRRLALPRPPVFEQALHIRLSEPFRLYCHACRLFTDNDLLIFK